MTIRNNWPQNWWPAIDENGKVLTRKSNFYDLASLAGVATTYDDYRLLSQMAHALMVGNLISIESGQLETRVKRMVDVFIVWGSAYMVTAVRRWNAVFESISDDELDDLRDAAVETKRQLKEAASL